jgi:hypothetical protein
VPPRLFAHGLDVPPRFSRAAQDQLLDVFVHESQF